MRAEQINSFEKINPHFIPPCRGQISPFTYLIGFSFFFFNHCEKSPSIDLGAVVKGTR